ncbi:hypothetical protein A9Q74_12325 [Colwellia sp. 39_35_sub15_T18]|nr:hypothetical protein A9Q74_12325 [Colwellia sp. 39_35_sub15_T18]
MLEHLFNSSFLYSLALTLLHFLWQGLLVATVLKSALLIVSNKNPQLRYLLSALAMLANLLLPLITFSMIYRSELVFTSASVLSFTNFIHESKQPNVFFNYQELSELLPSILPYIALLWLAAVILLASKLLLEIYNVNKLPQHGSVEPSTQLLTRFNELAEQINLTITPKLLISLKVDVPMAIGWLKPVVLIPATMISGLNSAQLEMLILHELAHIRRHDYLVNFLQTFVEILLFFHPAVLWVSKQMRNEREYCSDDIAVQHCGDAVAYAHTLADTASLCSKAHHHHTIPSMAMAASGGDLKQRVIRLVGHHCAPQNNISRWFASATIIFSILLLSSKQLLTMPLLDLWHSDTLFRANNDTITDANQANSMLANHNQLNSNKPPASSIAKQLLSPQTIQNKQTHTPHQSTEKVVPIVTIAADKQPTENNYNTVLSTYRKSTYNKQTYRSTSEQALATNDTAKFATQLSNLSITEHKAANALSESEQSNTSSMVEQAFQQTNSHKQYSAIYNPYAQELMQLAASDASTSKNSMLAISKQKSSAITVVQKDVNSTVEQKQPLHTKSFSQTFSQTLSQTVKPSKHKSLLTIKQNEVAISTKGIEQNLFQTLTQKTTPIWHNAKQLKSVNPIYPSVAKRKGIEIEVKVNFTIDINGQIKDIQFTHRNKINYFKSAIRSAIKQWRFSPAKVDGKPVESQMSKVFAFSLQS